MSDREARAAGPGEGAGVAPDRRPGGRDRGPAGDSPAELRDAAVEFAREAGALVRAGWGRIHAPER